MIKSVLNKAKSKARELKFAAVTGLYAGYMESAHAQGNISNVTSFMNQIYQMMPIIAKIAGALVFIGGMWSMYKHFKSQGRDGSVAAGIAGILIGAAFFLMGGLIRFVSSTTGIDSNALPQ